MTRKVYSCGLEAALDVIGGKWKVLILWHLSTEPRRFGNLRRQVAGITEKMLIQQLREMEADGLVHREAYPEIPPRVEYSLTDLGRGLIKAMAPLCAWGTKHMHEIGNAHLVETVAEMPVPAVKKKTTGPAARPASRPKRA